MLTALTVDNEDFKNIRVNIFTFISYAKVVRDLVWEKKVKKHCLYRADCFNSK